MKKLQLWLPLAVILGCAMLSASDAECSASPYEGLTCYVSSCTPDADGTLFCNNQEIDCEQVESMACKPACPECVQQEGEAINLECTSDSGESTTVRVEPRPRPRRVIAEYSEPLGGLTGDGADGGEWERSGFYSTH